MMRGAIGAIVLAACGGAAWAETPASAPATKPVVAVCDRDGMMERQLKREQGRADWTSAAEVLAAVREGRGWSDTRCLSKLDHWRVVNTVQRQEAAMRERIRAQRLLASR
jgi:hypothetical protein